MEPARLNATSRIAPTDSLFFAIRPDAAIAARVVELAATLLAGHHPKSTAVPADRLHITLHYLGAHAGLPGDLLKAAYDTANRIAIPPFEVTLDRIETFSTRRLKRPLVLSGDATQPLHDLERALAKSGFSAKPRPRFIPHITLLYTEQRIPIQKIEAITFKATEFLLIHSLLGRSKHEILARWPLHG